MSPVVHFEFQGSDPDALAKFYTELLAWKISRRGEAPYWLIETGAKDQPGIDGGLLKRNGQRPEDGQSVNAFVCTVQVSSVDEDVARAQSLGGTVAVPKMPIPTVGWLAYIKDPDGNIFGLMQPGPTAK